MSEKVSWTIRINERLHPNTLVGITKKDTVTRFTYNVIFSVERDRKERAESEAAVAKEVDELRDMRARLEKRLKEVEKEANKWKERYAKATKDEQQVPSSDY